MSDTQQSWAVQQSCPGNCQFSISKQSPNTHGF